MCDPAIAIDNLSLDLDGRCLLDGFSCRIETGERVVVTGPSGCGKTSLLRCMLGFTHPAKGTIRILGDPLDHRTVWAIRTQVAWVPQEPPPGSGTVRDVLARPMQYHANAHLCDPMATARELLEKLGLGEGILAKEAGDLSGGEKQRVAITAALMLRRPILLLDEVGSALDEENRARVAELLCDRPDLTILSAAHDPGDVELDARVVPLGQGGVA